MDTFEHFQQKFSMVFSKIYKELIHKLKCGSVAILRTWWLLTFKIYKHITSLKLKAIQAVQQFVTEPWFSEQGNWKQLCAKYNPQCTGVFASLQFHKLAQDFV